MKRLLLALVMLSTTVFAQTIRTIPMQNVFITYIGNTSHTWADPAVRGPQLVAQVNGFWHGSWGSWGAITYIDGGTKGWLDTAVTTTGTCPIGAIQSAVTAAYGQPPVGGIRHIVLPPGTPCYSAGGGNILWTQNGASVEHEVGHTLGLPHAQAKFPDGSVQAYGPYDVMGNGTYTAAINVNYRKQLNLYSPTFQLATVTAEQDVTLQLADNSTPGIKGLAAAQLMPGGFFSGPYTLVFLTAEFRGGDYNSKGVIIRDAGNILRTMNPLQQNIWRMVLGQTFCQSPACVTLTAQTATTATLHVSFGTPPPPPPPPTPLQYTDLTPADNFTLPIAQLTTTGVDLKVTTTDDSGIKSVTYTWGATTGYPAVKNGNVYSIHIVSPTGAAPGGRPWHFTITANDGEVVNTPTRTVIGS